MLSISGIITSMTKPGAMAPIVGLEATVTGGRTIQAYKRGGEDEARERLIEETTGAVVWLCGVKFLNEYVGDPILKKLFGANFDVGTDKVLRTPFENFMKTQPPKKLTAKQVAFIKAFKVLASVLIADAFIGLVVPPLNQKLTKNLRAKKQNENKEITSKENNKVNSNPSFKGGLVNSVNLFTYAIENNNTGKLLSTDAGLISGRMYSARNNDERREIAIRDIGSIYFYMWAQNHVGNVLNYIETGKTGRLNPNTAKILDKNLSEVLAKNGGEMSVEEFRKLVLGKKPSEITLKEGIKFEEGELSAVTKFFNRFRKDPIEPLKVAKVKDLEAIYTDPQIIERIREMSKLQPLRQDEAVITKQQIIDAINIAEINDPKKLNKIFMDFTDGASNDKYKFVSNKKLYNLKALMEDYVENICKSAKDGKITKDVLNKAKKKNLAWSGLNFVAGFGVAALFLSTLIPKFQYWVTKMKTGREDFPGTYELEK